MLKVVTLTHPGAVRPTNEDVVLWDPSLGLVAVADGLGGHNAGEVASRIAVDSMQQFLRLNPATRGMSETERLRAAMTAANRHVLHKSQESADFAGMATTLTAAIIDDSGHMWFGNVGDSRLYTKPAGSEPLRLLTRDDSLVDALSKSPGVRPAMLVNSRMRHLLTSAIGTKPDVNVEIEERQLSENELILLTTDGLHGPVGDLVMDAILDSQEQLNLDTAAEHLLDAALGSGGRDNITMAIARFTRGG